MKRFLVCILSFFTIVGSAFVFTACKDDKCDHEYGEWTTITAATCTINGERTRECLKCGEHDNETITALGHQFVTYVSNNDATCETNGTETATCSRDNCEETHTRTDENSALGHEWGTYVSDNNATCLEDGTKTAPCTHTGCDETHTITDEGTATGHEWGTYVSDNNATCLEDGTKTAPCTRAGCDETHTIDDEGSALGHEWGTHVSDNNATCLEDGTKTAPCTHTGCDETHTIDDEGSALGHEWTEYVANGDATHFSDGTKTATCERDNCEEQNTIADVGSKLDHKYTNYVSNNNATCEDDGTETATCDYAGCGETHTREEENSALGHDWTEYVANGDATCEADGTKTRTCQRTDCEAHDTVADEGTALGHEWGTYVSDNNATCLEDGTKTAPCTHAGCDETHTIDDEGSALGHEWGTYVSDNNATCLEDGTKTAPCTHAGCDETHTIDDEGSALGHDWSEYVSNGDATCEADGTKTRTCNRDNCEASETVTDFGSAGHNYEEESRVEATCAAAGSINYKCSNDGCDDTKVETIPATGHEWDKEAVTCLEGRECTVAGCGASEPALGHNHELVSVVAPTCENDGYSTYKCTRCDDTYQANTTQKLGHNVTEWHFAHEELVDGSTCDYLVTEEGICENCGQTQQRVYETTKHTLVKQIKVAATCVLAGKTHYVCTVEGCGHSEGEADYEDHDAHNLDNGTTLDGVTTYACLNEGCDYSREVVKVSSNEDGIATIDKSAITGVGEVELSDASIALNTELQNALGDGNVSIGAKKYDRIEDTDLVVTDQELLNKLAGKNIYDFTLTQGDTPVNFGEGGAATVRLPYELGENEDIDSIVIWYISGDGTLEEITDVTYSNGYVTFTTTHFSCYTVSNIDPDELCEVLGEHLNNVVTIDPTCDKGGYTLYTCQRCGLQEKHNLTPATGHSYTLDGAVVETHATCTEHGRRVYNCDNCDYSYVEVIAALGHHYEELSRVDATCSSFGEVVFACTFDGCDSSYKSTLAQKNHVYIPVVTDPTCENNGYTTYNCVNSGCEHSYVADYTLPLKHDYESVVTYPTCDKDGYTTHTCVNCEHTYTDTIVPAAHEFNIPKATCGESQVCVNCGAQGELATGEHSYNSASICTVCGEGCEHEYGEAVVKDPTCDEDGYTVSTCTICEYKLITDVVKATGHNGDFICLDCGHETISADFIREMIDSTFNGSFDLQLNDVEFTIVGDPDYDGVTITYELKFAELIIDLDDTQGFSAYGYAEIKGTQGVLSPVMKCYAVITQDHVYIKASGNDDGFTTLDSDMYMIFDANDISSDFGMVYGVVTDVLSIINQDIMPLVQSLSLGFVDLFGGDILRVYEAFFTLQETEDGYKLSLDPTKVYEFVMSLETQTIEQLFNSFVGEGAYDNLPQFIKSFTDLSFGDLLDMANEAGVDVEEFITKLYPYFELVVSAFPEDGGNMGQEAMPVNEEGENQGGQEEIEDIINTALPTLEEIFATINSEEFRSMTIADILLGVFMPTEEDLAGADPYEWLDNMIAQTIVMFGDITVVDIYNQMMDPEGENPLDLEMIANVLYYIDLDILTSLDGKALRYDLAVQVPMMTANISFINDYVSNINYGAIVSEVKNAVSKIVLTKENLEAVFDSVVIDGNIVTVTLSTIENDFMNDGYRDRYYVKYYSQNIQTYTYTFDTNTLSLDMISDCGYWVNIGLLCQSQYEYVHNTIEYLYDEETGELVDTIIEENYRQPSEDYNDHLGILYNKHTQEIKLEETAHNLVCSETIPGEGCDGYNEHHMHCTICGVAYIKYEPIGHGELTISGALMEGSTSCSDGAFVYYTCQTCGEVVYKREIYDCREAQIVTESLELPEEYTSHHKFDVCTCVCGQSNYIHYDGFTWSESYGDVTFLVCEEGICDLVIMERHTTTQLEGCKAIEHYAYYFYDGMPQNEDTEPIFYKELSVNVDNHNYYNFLTPMGETCADGVRFETTCVYCGHVNYVGEYEGSNIHGHYHGVLADSVVNLADFGSQGYVLLMGCVCENDDCDWEIKAGWADNQYARYYSENGVSGYLYTDYNGFNILIEYFSQVDGCTLYSMSRVRIGFDTENQTYEYITKAIVAGIYSEHDLDRTYYLADGAQSCADGVMVYEYCKNCDYTNVMEEGSSGAATHYCKNMSVIHENVSACGGDLVLYSCPCGKSNYYDFINLNCDLEELWVGGEEIDGTYYNNVCSYSCAVDGCGFEYTHRFYDEAADEPCLFKQIEQVELNGIGVYEAQLREYYNHTNCETIYTKYNEEAYPCLDICTEVCYDCGKEINSNIMFRHNTQSQVQDGSVIVVSCTNCDQYREETYYAHEIDNDTHPEGNQVVSRRYIHYEVVIDYNGDLVVLCHMKETNYDQVETLNGELTWVKRSEVTEDLVDYRENPNDDTYYNEARVTYNFYYSFVPEDLSAIDEFFMVNNHERPENCYCVGIGYDFYGREYGMVEWLDCNIVDYLYREGSCSQPDVYKEECSRCGDYTIYYGSYSCGHDFIGDDENGYACEDCGLESETGINGNVVLEVFENSEDTVSIGYYIQELGYEEQREFNDLYYYNISICYGDGEVCVLNNVNTTFSDDYNAISFAKADVQAAAYDILGEELPSVYEIKFAFISYGDSALEYAVTL